MRTYLNLSENELCDLLKSGDYAAFSEIYERYSFQLMSHALRKCKDDDYAKDLLQEVFTMLWENRTNLQIRKSLSAYLAASIRHSFLKNVKYEKDKDNYGLSLYTFVTAVSNDTTADHLIRKKQLEVIIEKELLALPPKMRQIFLKCRFQGFTHKQIAAELKISEKTVTRQVSNALAILKKKLPFFVFILLIDYGK
jgi:RNA polymerase sigma-70 factor (family 1)